MNSTVQTLFSLHQGQDSVVSIANCYLMDSLETESKYGKNFPHPFRPALGPTKPPIQGVPGHSQGRAAEALH